MEALNKIGYSAVGIGQNELFMPLLDALSEYSLNNPSPTVLAANLVNDETNAVILTMVEDTKVVQRPDAPTVGVIGLVAPSVNANINDNTLKFTPNTPLVLQNALTKLQKQSPDMTVLLYQGTEKEATLLAEFCAKNFKSLPNIDVILCLSVNSEPPAVTTKVPNTNTEIVHVGHKGRYVGVVGFYPSTKANRKYDLKYQLVSIGPKLNTPNDQKVNHILMQMMEEYTKDVKAGNYIVQYPSNMHEVQLKFPEAKYVGSQRCERCHEAEYKVWENSHHAHAYQTLEKQAKEPSLRQFDGECVSCHVVGFEHNTGYGDALRNEANDPDRVKMLRDVGCESCHGPGSAHIKDKRNKNIHMVMNPWKHRPNPKLAMNTFCQKCHDIDNDVHWDFDRKWPKIIHTLDPALAPAPNAGNADVKGGNDNALVIPGSDDTDSENAPSALVPKKD